MPALPWTPRTTPDPDRTYVVMGSRLPLRRHRSIPRFLAQSMKIRRQLATAPGLVGYALDARLLAKEFLTVSVWESREALQRFARAQPHAKVARTKPERMGRSRFEIWTVSGRDVPVPWSEVRARLDAEPRAARASEPTAEPADPQGADTAADGRVAGSTLEPAASSA